MIIRNYKLPPTYHLGSQGNGCAGEPPGHPRYFTRSVYTSYGNSPPYRLRNGNPIHPEYEFQGRYFTELKDVDHLFKPLPLEHKRTQAWIAELFRHNQHCYQDPKGTGSWGDNLVIYPVPGYKLQHFHDDPRFSEEWRKKEKASIEQANIEIEQNACRVATFDNHDATIIIRRHYPDFKPTQEQIENPLPYPGNWWTTQDEQPTPANCPGQYDAKHPVNGSWCQWCGWHS